VIFVKLWQFDADDRNQFRSEMDADLVADGSGMHVNLLHKDARETVRFVVLDAGSTLTETPLGGAELLMISGSATENGDDLTVGSWLRLPQDMQLKVTAGAQGAKFWIKTGHLPFAAAPLA
jgi:hypothetical protein